MKSNQEKRHNLTEYLASAFRYAQKETGLCPGLDETTILIHHCNHYDDYTELMGMKVAYAFIGSYNYSLAISTMWDMTDVSRFINSFHEYMELYPDEEPKDGE